MKTNYKTTLLVLAAGAFTNSSILASDPFESGDVCLAFYSEINGVVQNNTYVLNLGPGHLYRENTQNNVPLSTINPLLASSNIADDLETYFGEDWANDGSVRWALVGGVRASGGAVTGDPTRTNYLSAPRASFTAGSTGPDTTIPSLVTAQMGTLTTQVKAFCDATNVGINEIAPLPPLLPNGGASGANLAGVFLPKAVINTIDDFVPPATLGLYFGIGTDPRQILASGPISGGTGLEGALDVYRFLYTASGADLTCGASAGNAVVGTGQFIGTITLDASGNLKMQGVGAAAADYTTWATTNGVSGQAANLDHDNDGVSNGVEYFIGGPTGNTTGFTALPGVTTVGSVRSVTWTKAATYSGVYNTDFVVQTSTSLDAGSWTTETSGVNVIISGNDVTYTFPAGPAKTFARLKVTGP